MRLLGRGWQYTVYDLGNGKVLKRYNTWFEAYRVMLKDSLMHARLPVLLFSKYYNEGKVCARQSLGNITKSSLSPIMFGSPKMISEYDYEQTYAEPLSRYLKRVSTEKGKEMIDAFIEFNKTLARNSLLEKNCNIGDNFGINESGEIVIIDLGEICTSQKEIQQQINNRVWAAPDVLSRIPSSLHAYLVEKMDQAFVSARQ
jgi:hypothetical protein